MKCFKIKLFCSMMVLGTTAPLLAAGELNTSYSCLFLVKPSLMRSLINLDLSSQQQQTLINEPIERWHYLPDLTARIDADELIALAIQKSELEFLRFLVDDKNIRLAGYDNYLRSYVHAAVRKGDYALTKFLLDQGLKNNTAGYGAVSTGIQAAMYPKSDKILQSDYAPDAAMLKLLLENGADPTADSSGFAILYATSTFLKVALATEYPSRAKFIANLAEDPREPHSRATAWWVLRTTESMARKEGLSRLATIKIKLGMIHQANPQALQAQSFRQHLGEEQESVRLEIVEFLHDLKVNGY